MVKVLESGFYASIQDMGRRDYSQYGVPISGVMDAYSAKIANALVGNMQDAAVLEITMTGTKLKFNCSSRIAISGAHMTPKLNSSAIAMNSNISVEPEDILTFGALTNGFRSYLAVSGGFQTNEILESRSMYKGITTVFKLEKEQVLEIKETTRASSIAHSTIKMDKSHFDSEIIEVYSGPEFDMLNELQRKELLTSRFSISKYNSRMAYQLEETLKNRLDPIITSLVMPGTVQLTPSGKLIILMRDCQTTGGYPRVLQLSELAISRLAQKFTNQHIRFSLIDYV